MIDFGVTIPHYIECLPNSLFVKNIEYGERTLKSGFIVPAEKMDYEGHFARPRWAKVFYKSDNINYIDVGDGREGERRVQYYGYSSRTSCKYG